MTSLSDASWSAGRRSSEVLEAVRKSVHPPTNPAVLLEAARDYYLQGKTMEMLTILGWLLQVVAENSIMKFNSDLASDVSSCGYNLHIQMLNILDGNS